MREYENSVLGVTQTRESWSCTMERVYWFFIVCTFSYRSNCTRRWLSIQTRGQLCGCCCCTPDSSHCPQFLLPASGLCPCWAWVSVLLRVMIVWLAAKGLRIQIIIAFPSPETIVPGDESYADPAVPAFCSYPEVNGSLKASQEGASCQFHKAANLVSNSSNCKKTEWELTGSFPAEHGCMIKIKKKMITVGQKTKVDFCKRKYKCNPQNELLVCTGTNMKLFKTSMTVSGNISLCGSLFGMCENPGSGLFFLSCNIGICFSSALAGILTIAAFLFQLFSDRPLLLSTNISLKVTVLIWRAVQGPETFVPCTTGGHFSSLANPCQLFDLSPSLLCILSDE